ncbi:hypothetical protein BASA81_004163 [Batrachochytrium salamandrivorans]|nr:hypothetical protein BASA81_004163 [Batrachochytrium salamandrivorans]
MEANKRQRVASNPYLQTSSQSRRQQAEVFSKRNRRGDRALVFNAEEEEQQPQNVAPPAVPEALPCAPVKRFKQPPPMEWWDRAFLPKDHHTEADGEDLYLLLKPTNQKTLVYVEHPVYVPPTKQSLDSDEPFKLYQTKKELKKTRRQNRAVLTQEKRDKIAIGLLDAPKAKVKISNLLRVLAADHAADPTQIEARVRQEMDQRELQHVARNLAKKLTPRERADKFKKRIQRDVLPTGGIVLAVFAIHGHGLWDMESANELAKKRLARVVLTARKLLLTGRFAVVAAPTSVPGVIVVEGGPKSVRKFARLVTQRIDWKSKTLMEAEINKTLQQGESSEEDEDSDEEGGEETNKGGGAGLLLWRGVAPKREFEGFQMEKLESKLDARQLFAGKNLAHLWDLAIANN